MYSGISLNELFEIGITSIQWTDSKALVDSLQELTDHTSKNAPSCYGCCLWHPKFVILLGWLVRGQWAVVVVLGDGGWGGGIVGRLRRTVGISRGQ